MPFTSLLSTGLVSFDDEAVLTQEPPECRGQTLDFHPGMTRAGPFVETLEAMSLLDG